MYDREKVIDIYKKTGSIKITCAETGVAAYIIFIVLKKSGLLTAQEKQKYGGVYQQRGANAEAEFQKLVPAAMNSNKHLESNCPSFDFDINGAMVDVKYSSLRPSTGRWEFKTAHAKTLQPDFYVCFFATSESGELRDGYRIFLFPSELLGDRKVISISPKKDKCEWLDFEIKADELSNFFEYDTTEKE